MLKVTTKGETHTLLEQSDILDTIMPVGYIYISATSVDPATLFGGTWKRISGQFLMGAAAGSDGYHTINRTGGNETALITESNLPAHYHYQQRRYESTSANQPNSVFIPTGKYTKNWMPAVQVDDLKTTLTGNNTPIEILPPYLTVDIWKRTA